MNEKAPKGINIPEQYALPIQLLEKFRHPRLPTVPSTIEATSALEAGNPTELQIEEVLGEIDNLIYHLKDMTSFWPELSNESVLASNVEQLKEAKKIMYESLIKINPEKSKDHEKTSAEQK